MVDFQGVYIYMTMHAWCQSPHPTLRCPCKSLAIQMVPWHSFQILYPLENDNKQNLGGGFKHLNFFHPYLGKISNLSNIFQMGWKHQLETYPLKIDGWKTDSLDRFFKVFFFLRGHVSHTKHTGLTFHFTSWLTGILISLFMKYSSHNCVVFVIPYIN